MRYVIFVYGISMKKQYTNISKNSWVIMSLWSGVLCVAVTAVVFLALALPLWSILLAVGIALLLAVVAVVVMTINSVMIDAYGVTVRRSNRG